MRIGDWSSDVCASDLLNAQGVVWLPDQAHIRAGTSGFVTRVAVPEGTIVAPGELLVETTQPALETDVAKLDWRRRELQAAADSELGGDMVKRRISQLEIDEADHRLPNERQRQGRSEKHTTELQSLIRTSYAVFCRQN